MDLTVIAAGNVLMGDDGVGVRVIERLVGEPGGPPPRSDRPAPAIECLDGGAGGLRLLNWIEQANRLLFVDAARFGGRPGECRLLTLEQLLGAKPQAGGRRRAAAGRPVVAAQAAFSLHQTDLAGVLRLARQFYRVPPTWLLAIQVASAEPRPALSEPLAGALPRLVETVRRLARRLALAAG